MVNFDAKARSAMPQLGITTDNFIRQLLDEQQQLTAVGEFSSWHDQSPIAHGSHYRSMLPSAAPKAGEQFAFEVDLDACSGCKACVTACHNLNGLEEQETWRHVGMLLGIDDVSRPQQYVTTACHHCVEPGCLQGCPVNAYDKDLVTGIVRHLDDQCIGCQYCILMCPYEVPQYSESKGIVRKCDMCRQRLEVGSPPACVAGCPNQAIRISIVSQDAARLRAVQSLFLAASPDPQITIPTTVYKSSRSREVLSSDSSRTTVVSARNELPTVAHAHWPLVVMLVLTQLSVGALFIERILTITGAIHFDLSLTLLATSAVVGVVGGNAAALHLGKPFGAWRAWIGLRTSWLSREIIALGLYGGINCVAVSLAYFRYEPWASIALAIALAVGIIGVVSSAMIYVATRRALWSLPSTLTRFFACMLGLGLSLATAVAVVGEARSSVVILLAVGSTSVGAVQLIAVYEPRLHLYSAEQDHRSRSMRRTSLLLATALADQFQIQLITLTFGGLFIPGLLLLMALKSPLQLDYQAPLVPLAIVGLLILLGGNLLERLLFFQSCAPAKMPGDDR